MTVIPTPRAGTWPAGTLLDLLSPESRAALLDLGVPKVYRRGEVMLREAEESDHVVLLVRAVVKATVTLENGRVALLSIKVGGDVVGEMAALSGEPRSATVTVCGDADVRVISSVLFREYLGRFPEANLALTRMIMQTLRWADKRRTDFNGYPAYVRLARVLDELADGYGRAVPEGVTLDLGLTQRELGALVGAEEDTARKELRSLRDRGVIRMGYRTITIVDREVLSSIAYDWSETR
ncbi:Crp/Fnr family transcriptional regulator [Actinosynnema sp. NPDC047251]|uniref:Transcriptional regulator, Crp/Fnr family n=1 Tax=Saccharothrix espanaensis (strain ATCC 51144 / DSM 44229 / JCM 9112 / NBRC 15066 / NRRL 15764) TaxID=1179773 RepID=K0K8P2_SACES|nr:Crp/Fnr family transcriptional regulator [Saccharothrix espanaensis]CCH33912.1 Transcriptional regulator, Crp/Fnr family [Saccharothrix espanaensis DSM 44229]